MQKNPNNCGIPAETGERLRADGHKGPGGGGGRVREVRN